MRFTESSLDAIQQAAESEVVKLLEDANLAAIHAGRETIKKKDLILVQRMWKHKDGWTMGWNTEEVRDPLIRNSNPPPPYEEKYSVPPPPPPPPQEEKAEVVVSQPSQRKTRNPQLVDRQIRGELRDLMVVLDQDYGEEMKTLGPREEFVNSFDQKNKVDKMRDIVIAVAKNSQFTGSENERDILAFKKVRKIMKKFPSLGGVLKINKRNPTEASAKLQEVREEFRELLKQLEDPQAQTFQRRQVYQRRHQICNWQYRFCWFEADCD